MRTGMTRSQIDPSSATNTPPHDLKRKNSHEWAYQMASAYEKHEIACQRASTNKATVSLTSKMEEEAHEVRQSPSSMTATIVSAAGGAVVTAAGVIATIVAVVATAAASIVATAAVVAFVVATEGVPYLSPSTQTIQRLTVSVLVAGAALAGVSRLVRSTSFGRQMVAVAQRDFRLVVCVVWFGAAMMLMTQFELAVDWLVPYCSWDMAIGIAIGGLAYSAQSASNDNTAVATVHSIPPMHSIPPIMAVGMNSAIVGKDKYSPVFASNPKHSTCIKDMDLLPGQFMYMKGSSPAPAV